jgi:hypothetical protein
MLSPADYAAYSRATGLAYPQSDEEKANMYGDVRDFRRNQLKKDDGPNLAGTMAIGAAAIGGIAGAGLLGRKLLANAKRNQTPLRPKTERASGQPGAPGGGSNDLATLQRMQKDVASAIPQATTDIPQTAASNSFTNSSVQDSKQGSRIISLSEQFTADNIQAGAESKAKSNVATGSVSGLAVPGSGFKQFSQSADQIAGEAVTPQIVEKKITFQDASPAPATRSQQVAAQSAEQKAKNFASASVNTMVDIQESREPIIKVQSVDALDTAGDQLDNKLESVVQRDTDSIFKGKQAVASELKFTAEDLLNSQLPMEQTTDRIMAAASANNEVANMLLDPNVSTRQLSQMGVLGSSMKMDKATGRVEANPTFEIQGGASASMSDRPSRARKLVGASVDDESSSNYGDMYGSADGEYLDLDTGAGIEGSAYLKETEGYTESTNKGQTFLAGKVQEMTGSVPQSSRQERVLDEFVPIRQVGGEESPGVLMDEQGRMRLQAGGTPDTDLNITGNRQVGNIDSSEPTPYFALDNIVGMKVAPSGFNNITIRGKKVWDMDEAMTIPVAGRYTPGDDRLAIQPFMFNQVVKTDAGPRQVRRSLYGPLMMEAEDGFTPTALSRTEVGQLLDQASVEFKDPSTQRKYLQKYDSDYLATLDPDAPIVTRPFDETGYQAARLDYELRNPEGSIMRGRSVGLPVLRDPSAKHRFVTDVTNTSVQRQEWGKAVDDTGFPIKGAKNEPTGVFTTKGLGGTPVYEYADAGAAADAGEKIAFKSPRLELNQARTPAESRPVAAPSNPVATSMADTRAKLEKVKPSRVVSIPDSIDVYEADLADVPVDVPVDYDVGSVMQQTMAQAGRRRGSKRK